MRMMFFSALSVSASSPALAQRDPGPGHGYCRSQCTAKKACELGHIGSGVCRNRMRECRIQCRAARR